MGSNVWLVNLGKMTSDEIEEQVESFMSQLEESSNDANILT